MNNIEGDSMALGFSLAPPKEKMTRAFLSFYQCRNMILGNYRAMQPRFRGSGERGSEH